jgi:hypothetical protein
METGQADRQMPSERKRTITGVRRPKCLRTTEVESKSGLISDVKVFHARLSR